MARPSKGSRHPLNSMYKSDFALLSSSAEIHISGSEEVFNENFQTLKEPIRPPFFKDFQNLF